MATDSEMVQEALERGCKDTDEGVDYIFKKFRTRMRPQAFGLLRTQLQKASIQSRIAAGDATEDLVKTLHGAVERHGMDRVEEILKVLKLVKGL